MLIILTAGLVLCFLGLVYLWGEIRSIHERLALPTGAQAAGNEVHTRDVNRILDLEARVARLEEGPGTIGTA